MVKACEECKNDLEGYLDDYIYTCSFCEQDFCRECFQISGKTSNSMWEQVKQYNFQAPLFLEAQFGKQYEKDEWLCQECWEGFCDVYLTPNVLILC